jgi:heparan-alpha-glucosaminide N-acetyltransferase
MNQLPRRLLSIDVFRAVTMLFMIFVNDLEGAHNIPDWIEHVKDNVDGLGFADTIFPAFLFIVGLSLPFSINNRLKKGESFNSIAGYILLRSLALIIIGVFHVNLESYSNVSLLSKPMWGLLAHIAFFLIWLDYPAEMVKVKKYTLIGAGIIILVFLVIVFRGGKPGHIHAMKHSWWGILGIIGWAYLVCASVYLLVKGRLWILITMLLIFLIISIVSHLEVFDMDLWVIDDASSVSLVMCGGVISVLYAQLAEKGKAKYIWGIFSAIALMMLAGGFLARPYTGGISKIYSTTAWVMICSGISILVFELMIYLVDVRGKQNWFKLIRPAGTSTLTCYLIPYFQFYILKLLHVKYPHIINSGVGALIRAMVISFLVIIFVGYLERRKFRLKI